MKRYFGFIVAAIAAMFLAGCFGSGGSSAPAPVDASVTVTPKDSRVVVTWAALPGVEYWIFHAPGTGVTPQNCSSMSALCATILNATSPTNVSGLVNGTTYSFSINGRTGGGPGGPGSTAKEATPRPAGDTWVSSGAWGSLGNTATSASDLHGVAYGTTVGFSGLFVAAGNFDTTANGALFTSADGKAWTALTTTSGTNFNAITFDTGLAKYLAVGNGGAVETLVSTSTNVWIKQTATAGTTALNAVTSNGTGYFVATGAVGTIMVSSGGTTWTAATSIPSAAASVALNGVAYGYSTTLAKNIFVAVGAAGTVLYSEDGLTWTSATSNTTYDLKSVKYGGLDASSHSIFVAVGANGTVLTSEDGITWTAQTSISTATLNAVTYSSGRRFIAVAADGNIYYSEYYTCPTCTVGNGAVTWTQVTPAPTTSPINAVTTGGLFDFSAVGPAGLNLYSD